MVVFQHYNTKEQIISKEQFAQMHGITVRQLDTYIKYHIQNTIVIAGQKWLFFKRDIPKPVRTPRAQIQKKPMTDVVAGYYEKKIGNLLLIISKRTDRLVKTISI